jgi:hypothetical protein
MANELPSGIIGGDLALFRAARQEKTLSDASLRSLAKIGYDAKRPTTGGAEQYDGDVIHLVNLLGDDSGSMDNPPVISSSEGYLRGVTVESKAQILEIAQNAFIDSLLGFPNAEAYRIQTALLNAGVLTDNEGQGFLQLQRAIRLRRGVNLNPNGGTPLRARTIETLGRAMAEAQSFRANFVTDIRVYLMLATDGAATDFHLNDSDVKPLIDDARASTAIKFFLTALAMDDDKDCIDSLKRMGFLDSEIVRPGGNAAKIAQSIDSTVTAIQRVANMDKRKMLALPSGEIAAIVRADLGK